MFSKLTWIKELRGAELSDPEFRVLVMLSTWTDKNGRDAFPGNVQLADACHMQPRSVIRILRRLEEKGWIMRTFQGGNEVGMRVANVYALHSPVIHKGDPPSHKGDPPVRLKGDPPSHLKGDPPVTPSGPIHQIHASGPGTAFRPRTSDGGRGAPPTDTGHADNPTTPTTKPADPWARKSAEQKDKTSPDWDAMRGDILLLEDHLEGMGIDTARHSSVITARWENQDHPKAIAYQVFKEDRESA